MTPTCSSKILSLRQLPAEQCCSMSSKESQVGCFCNFAGVLLCVFRSSCSWSALQDRMNSMHRIPSQLFMAAGSWTNCLPLCLEPRTVAMVTSDFWWFYQCVGITWTILKLKPPTRRIFYDFLLVLVFDKNSPFLTNDQFGMNHVFRYQVFYKTVPVTVQHSSPQVLSMLLRHGMNQCRLWAGADWLLFVCFETICKGCHSHNSVHLSTAVIILCYSQIPEDHGSFPRSPIGV